MPEGDFREVCWVIFSSLEEEMKMQRKEGLALLQTYKNNKLLASSLARLLPAEPKRRGFSCG